MFFVVSRYLSQNFDWLQEQLDDIDDDYILFDCPGMYMSTCLKVRVKIHKIFQHKIVNIFLPIVALGV